ncbi:hypothetical protein [Cetobacterium sp.]|uniref:hypothetical protein n=1 Tax=Cetobacterium sp. TaxID=2071632 RepID=UPI003F6713B5
MSLKSNFFFEKKASQPQKIERDMIIVELIIPDKLEEKVYIPLQYSPTDNRVIHYFSGNNYVSTVYGGMFFNTDNNLP